MTGTLKLNDFRGGSGSAGLKLLIWTVIPTHHQSAFFAALRASGADLVVHYFGTMSPERTLLGWRKPELGPGEREVVPTLASVRLCPDWRERLHLVPGYSKPFLLLLASWLSLNRATWLHWSEPSHPDSRSWLNTRIRRVYGTVVNRFAAGALAIGELATQSFIDWGIRRDKIRFLPYAIAAPKVGANQFDGSVHLGTPHFLFLGALCHRKAVDVLLHAFRRVADAYSGATLDIVGHDHSQGDYHRLASELGLTQSVRIATSVPADQVGNMIARCDVLVLPSRFDGWGMVLNEAAALGRALISTHNCGAAHHLLVPGRNGFRVPAGDDYALAEAMLAYCRRPELASQHGAESVLIFQDFTPERNAQRLLEAVGSLAAFPTPLA